MLTCFLCLLVLSLPQESPLGSIQWVLSQKDPQEASAVSHLTREDPGTPVVKRAGEATQWKAERARGKGHQLR